MWDRYLHYYNVDDETSSQKFKIIPNYGDAKKGDIKILNHTILIQSETELLTLWNASIEQKLTVELHVSSVV